MIAARRLRGKYLEKIRREDPARSCHPDERAARSPYNHQLGECALTSEYFVLAQPVSNVRLLHDSGYQAG